MVRGQGQGGRVPPETSDWEISADLPGKERQGKKGKWSFSLLKITEIFLGLPKWEFTTRKKHFTLGNDFPPLKNIPLMPLVKNTHVKMGTGTSTTSFKSLNVQLSFKFFRLLRLFSVKPKEVLAKV